MLEICVLAVIEFIALRPDELMPLTLPLSSAGRGRGCGAYFANAAITPAPMAIWKMIWLQSLSSLAQ